MTDFSVDFLGCKVSHTDAETIRHALLDAGHGEAQAARVRVVNTCCITAEAEKKSRKKVRQLLRADDDVQVFVTGCGAALRPDYGVDSERVTTLPGAASLAAATIVRAADRLAGLGCKGALPDEARARRTRAFVKVQDGCSFTCSYCIVPTVRGTTRSRELEAVLADVRRRIARGQREIVLTGVNIGLYRDPSSRAGLDRVVTAVADVEGVARVRISSIEVNHVNRRLIAAIADHPKVCPHLHVPLQSGDDGVLAGMRRHYTSTTYLRALARAREALPGLNLTTDVIVGFPGEDDAAFANTLRVVHELDITKVHAFPFSPRPGTDADAAHAAAAVPAGIVRERSLRLRTEAQHRAHARWQAKVGTRDDVVVEPLGTAGATLTDPDADAAGAADTGGATSSPPHAPVARGYTRDYCPVRLLDGDAAAGDLLTVTLVGCDEHGLLARV